MKGELERIPLEGNGTMSSLVVAQITGKQHAHVMRDIRHLLKQGVNESNFGLVNYTDPKGESRPCYQLTKKGCLILASGYRPKLREAIIDRWEELETEKREKREVKERVPKSFSEALLLAAEQQKVIERQREEIRMLEERHEEVKERMNYLDKIFASNSTCKVKVIAQDYGFSAVRFNELLHSHGIQYKSGEQWILYSKYVQKGYVKSVSFEYQHSNGMLGVKYNTQWTQKGRCFLYTFLKQKGIVPLIEREG